MPNALTGEFDVVAQFAIPAANRLLAAMHRTTPQYRQPTPEPFPHQFAEDRPTLRIPLRIAATG